MSIEYVGRGSADGIILGRTSGNGAKIGFFGETPVVKQTASIALVTVAAVTSSVWGFSTSTQAEKIATSVNTIITNSAVYGLDM